MNPLELELVTYAEKLPSLLMHAGKHVLIKGDEVITILDSYEDTLKAGYEKFKLEPFLVKRIAPTESTWYERLVF